MPSPRDDYHNASSSIPRVGLTIEEAALYSGIGQSTLRELVNWGKVPGLMVGRKIIIHINILDFFMRVNQGRNLRDRPADIPELSKVIIQEMAAKMKRPLSITSEAVMSLQRYHWPGNVRELRNVLELSAFMTSGETIEESDLPPLAQDPEEPDPVPLKERIRAYELQEIRRTVQRYGDTTEGKCLAAKALGISLSTLYRKLDASLP